MDIAIDLVYLFQIILSIFSYKRITIHVTSFRLCLTAIDINMFLLSFFLPSASLSKIFPLEFLTKRKLVLSIKFPRIRPALSLKNGKKQHYLLCDVNGDFSFTFSATESPFKILFFSTSPFAALVTSTSPLIFSTLTKLMLTLALAFGPSIVVLVSSSF